MLWRASRPRMSVSSMSVRFWGVRGSIACSGPDTARYGGNTPCVEIRCGDHVLIFDAGTGIRPLGNALMRETNLTEVDIFLSHCHIDHVVGLPFFAPFFFETSCGAGVGRQLGPGSPHRRCSTKADQLSAFSDPNRRVQGQTRISRFQGRRHAQSAVRGDVAHGRPQSSWRCNRISDRLRRPISCVSDRHRMRQWTFRSGRPVVGQGCSGHSRYALYERGTALADWLGTFELAAGSSFGR